MPLSHRNTKGALCNSKSTLVDSAGRANASTAAAGNAGISVNNILAISLRNSADRALALAGTATNTSISNYICHNRFLLKYSKHFVVPLFYTI